MGILLHLLPLFLILSVIIVVKSATLLALVMYVRDD
jgi:hypothetical protein